MILSCTSFFSALLRIADEMDEDERRIEARIIDSVPKEMKLIGDFVVLINQ